MNNNTPTYSGLIMEAIDIKHAIQKVNVTQEQIAERAGCTQPFVTKVIQGKTPGLTVWPIIIDILGYDPREVNGENPNHSD